MFEFFVILFLSLVYLIFSSPLFVCQSIFLFVCLYNPLMNIEYVFIPEENSRMPRQAPIFRCIPLKSENVNISDLLGSVCFGWNRIRMSKTGWIRIPDQA